MHIFKSTLGQKLYKFDRNDIVILLLLSLGVTSCTELSSVMGISKSAVTQRIDNLSTAKLVKSVENYNEKSYYRKYQITKLGEIKLNEVISDRYIA